MKRVKSDLQRAVVMLVMALLQLVCAAAGSPLRPLDAADLLPALDAGGVHVRAEQIEILAAVRLDAAALELNALVALPGQSAAARLRCKEPAHCVPFYAVVNFAGRKEQQQALSGWRAARATTRVHVARKARVAWLVASGQPATLVIEGRQMRATTRVICLERGQLGQTVRALAADHKTIMTGVVVAPGMLKAAL